jgi:SulP family sulfate permease
MGGQQWMTGEPLFIMLGLVALTMGIIHFLPKLTTAIPSSLVAIVTVTGLVIGLDLEAHTV